MKNVLFFLLVVVSFSLNAQNKGNNVAEEVKKEVSTPEFVIQKSKAKIEFESLDVDFGTIEYDSDPIRKVRFTNVGTEPLVIESARASCGCTVPTFKREPIAPGESSEMEVRYDTKRVGRISKTVTVKTNDEIGEYRLQVIGDILPKPEEKSVPESAPSMIKTVKG